MHERLIDIRTPQEWRQTGIAKGAHRVDMLNPGGAEGFARQLLGEIKGDRTVTLRWTAAKARGAAIRDHQITYATTPKGPWLPVTEGTCAARPVRTRTCTVTGLEPATTYWFRTAAINAKDDAERARALAEVQAAAQVEALRVASERAA